MTDSYHVTSIQVGPGERERERRYHYPSTCQPSKEWSMIIKEYPYQSCPLLHAHSNMEVL